MLRECVRLCPCCSFEGHGAEGTFEEDLTVGALDVGLYRCNISEDHAAVDTAATRRNVLFGDMVDKRPLVVHTE